MPDLPFMYFIFPMMSDHADELEETCRLNGLVIRIGSYWIIATSIWGFNPLQRNAISIFASAASPLINKAIYFYKIFIHRKDNYATEGIVWVLLKEKWTNNIEKFIKSHANTTCYLVKIIYLFVGNLGLNPRHMT